MAIQNQNSQKHIYLVDDDHDDRSMFAEVLLDHDCSIIVTEVENGKQLMDILQRPPSRWPEVIFLDLNMPIKNGFECLKEIRNHDGEMQNLNIIILTTSSDPVTIAKAFELGATFYAVKPNSFDGLKSLARDILAIDWFSPRNLTRVASAHLLTSVNF